MATRTKKETVATVAADYPKRWVFDERDQGKADWVDGSIADGHFVRFEQAPAAEYGVKPILILAIEGAERSIWVLHDALYGRIRDELSLRSMPKLVPGERVVIEKLEGKTESKNGRSYVNYRVLFPDAPAPDEAAMFGFTKPPIPIDESDEEANPVAAATPSRMACRSSKGAEVGEGDLAHSLLRAALELAAHGHPVLPLHVPRGSGCSCGRRCGREGKHPRGVYGLSHASTDSAWVRRWWELKPVTNIGMRCDGLAVIDVDSHVGARSLATLEEELGPLPETWEQATGRGRHLIYAADVPGNSTAALGDPPGIDLRCGTRGYIVAAPSLHVSGRRYERRGQVSPVPLPTSWQEQLARAPVDVDESASTGRPAPPPIQPASGCRWTTAYGAAALAGELEDLLRAPQGDRNNQLNKSMFRLAQLVAGGELSHDDLWSAAYRYGRRIGLDHREVVDTLRSASAAGTRQPRRRQQR